MPLDRRLPAYLTEGGKTKPKSVTFPKLFDRGSQLGAQLVVRPWFDRWACRK